MHNQTLPSRAPSLERRRGQGLALGAALVSVTLWASAFVGIRAAGRDLSPGALTLGRLLIGSLALGGLVLARREPLPARRDLPAIALSGLLWFGVYNVALNEAERRIDAGTAAMLINVSPILVAVLAGIVLRERVRSRLLVGIVVAIVGSTITGLATADQGVHAGWGAVLCLVAAMGYAGAVVAQKPVLARVSALQVTWLACSTGALACLPFAPTLLANLRHADRAALGWMLYLGAFPTAVGFTTWAFALARSNAGRLSAMTYLVPPLALVMGWALLGETPPALAVLGGAICLAGVAIARRTPRGRGGAGS
jgi:drug/metabolite transporter (DMT)-like permease